MSDFKDKSRPFVAAGISDVWYLPMSSVTLQPTGAEDSQTTKDLQTSSVLIPMMIEAVRASYVEEPQLGENGLGLRLGVEWENIVLTAEKDDALNKMMRKRYLIFFRDNHGQYRFILNARVLGKVSTGAFINGKPAYNFTVAAGATKGAYYYSGTVRLDSGGYAALS
jgi:hypothetical protein